ncbi:hypothetical protein N7468_007966 [Penicillium chermesinum]|uniref:Ceramide glucosyltransferase n=1 Tax=Penicillium chermesinum TaxID=63820 RepID=A0A9W9NNW6_9EURO|nr:uncharacterized protein N7468_007966 [Penicillium chermesinum]KAJ5223424.1 hypothetical protein N7468_007966 [Penicillium chermesinum]
MLDSTSRFAEYSLVGNGDIPVSVAAGWIGLIWYCVVLLVCALGYFQIWRYFLRQPEQSPLANSPDAPHVTAIRPVKGLEPHLYDCLAATFRQDYPRDKLSICLCVSTRDDPAYPVLCQLVEDFPEADARVYVEEEDPLLQQYGRDADSLGPNPKIRNMSRAYREAKGDLIWTIDCNVWVSKGVCGRMVNKLCGTAPSSTRKYKFVHHLPVAVDVTGEAILHQERQILMNTSREDSVPSHALSVDRPEDSLASTIATGGGRLEELFLSSAHAKMYTAINTVLVAPCIVDYLTAPSSTNPHPRHPGIDFFSDNICEDHLIGDLLWRKKVREEEELGERWGKHAMVFGDLAIQPVANMQLRAYIARRVRWLRVRKFTVLLATLVEPGTESFVCSIYGAYGVTTALAPYREHKGFSFASSLQSWTAFFSLFALSIALWILVDWTLYIILHSGRAIEVDKDTPPFARLTRTDPSHITRRPFVQWLSAWLGRELLALPIWLSAVYGGVTVVWRDRQFKVGFDAKVREINPDGSVPSGGSYSTGSVVDWFPLSPKSSEDKHSKPRRD